MKPLAIVFVYVWPEPYSSAAGVRTVSLCQDLMALGYEVKALSPCRENEASAALQALGIGVLHSPANDSSIAGVLRELSPSLVLYDRFVMEEQFGWRAREIWPGALHVVDTQDLHSVRRARERLVTAGRPAEEVFALAAADFGTDLDRELSSLYRADACLVVSTFERDWLIGLGYPEDRVFWLPFGAAPESDRPGFGERAGFIFLGNFRHPPNLDGLKWLVEKLWPQIRSQVNGAELSLVGAYPPAWVSSLDGRQGIRALGPLRDHRAELKRRRVLLAPLRYGAGIKGKVLEAWACGTAVAGTEVAFEGFGVEASEDFVAEAVRLHEDESAWGASVARGNSALERFSPIVLREQLKEFLALGLERREVWRQHLVSRMLKHHFHNSTKYFSQWIEAKNRRI